MLVFFVKAKTEPAPKIYLYACDVLGKTITYLKNFSMLSRETFFLIMTVQEM